MREIKFKCLIIGNDKKVVNEFYEWLDGDGWKHSYYAPLVMNGVFSYDELGDGFLGEIVRLRFTGLLDKNGKEIYEGDIFPSNSDGIKFYKLIFENGGFVLYHNYGYWGTLARFIEASEKFNFKLEVIGNIYSTPDLLPPNP